MDDGSRRSGLACFFEACLMMTRSVGELAVNGVFAAMAVVVVEVSVMVFASNVASSSSWLSLLLC